MKIRIVYIWAYKRLIYVYYLYTIYLDICIVYKDMYLIYAARWTSVACWLYGVRIMTFRVSVLGTSMTSRYMLIT